MNRKRLLKLAEFLETAELPGEFMMGTWCDTVDDGKPKCGTAACALGWATTIPEFREAGLYLDKYGFPNFGDAEETEAGAAFFDIDYNEAVAIFTPRDLGELNGAQGRAIVAKRIRELVATTP